MHRPQIALLDASHGSPHTRRNFRRELAADVVVFDVTEGELPADFSFDGCVVSGSRSSVYWGEEWVHPLSTWIEDAHERGLPALGVCFGHQLLASALGGDVDAMGEYEIGYREIEHTGESAIFDGVDRRFTAFTTHSDEVVRLPPGAELLAENDYSIHAFQKDDAYGVQFHPEYDVETARELVDEKDLPARKRRRVIEGINENNYRASLEAKRVFDNFLKIVGETSVDESVDESVESVVVEESSVVEGSSVVEESSAVDESATVES